MAWRLSVKQTISMAIQSPTCVITGDTGPSTRYSYDRLTHEQPIATLKFSQYDNQKFNVEVSYSDGQTSDIFLLNGEEWQMDARIIKWRGWAQLLGLNTQYRLERISGRYSDIDDELNKPRSVFAINPKDKIDYWKLMNTYKQWLPWVDAYYGSATYLPMMDNTSYLVSLTASGLIARPLDVETEHKLKLW
ncbi:MAG: hypothetical protein AAF419_04470 [Pseudomonadota bacterium]